MEYACLPGYIFKLGRACETGSNAHAFVGNAWDTPRLIPLFVRSWPDTFPVWSSFIKDRDSCLQCVRLFVLPALCEPWEGLSKVEGFVIVIKVIICRPSAHDFILIPTFLSCNTPTAATLLTSLGLCYCTRWTDGEFSASFGHNLLTCTSGDGRAGFWCGCYRQGDCQTLWLTACGMEQLSYPSRKLPVAVWQS